MEFLCALANRRFPRLENGRRFEKSEKRQNRSRHVDERGRKFERETNEKIFGCESNNARRESIDVKTSLQLFSLNIGNYPSYETALSQLQNTFGCEPISIKTATIKVNFS